MKARNNAMAANLRTSTEEVAKLLGIDASNLRLLMPKGKIKAPPILFDPKTNSTARTWSGDDTEEARKVLKSIKS
jgi:hypothetical protein